MTVEIRRGRLASLFNDRNDDYSDEAEVEVEPYIQFDMQEPGHCLLLVGRGKSGKTTMMRWLYHVNKKIGAFDYVVVMCNSPQIHTAYSWVPQKLRQPYSAATLKYLLQIQEAYIKRGTPKRLLLIMDDIVGSVNLHNGENKQLIEKLTATGRHFNILTAILVQHYHRVPPTVRSNAWYTLICNPSTKDVKEFYDQYHTHDTLTECQSFMKSCARDHTFAYVCSDDDEPRLVRVPADCV